MTRIVDVRIVETRDGLVRVSVDGRVVVDAAADAHDALDVLARLLWFGDGDLSVDHLATAVLDRDARVGARMLVRSTRSQNSAQGREPAP